MASPGPGHRELCACSVPPTLMKNGDPLAATGADERTRGSSGQDAEAGGRAGPTQNSRTEPALPVSQMKVTAVLLGMRGPSFVHYYIPVSWDIGETQ